MKYDVFLVSASEDLDKADQVARRLRALKFKVRFDKKRAHSAATPKDIADLETSICTLILWSKAGVDPDKDTSAWIYQIGAMAKDGETMLIQAALDRAIPRMPFEDDSRNSLFGLAPRKLNRGFNIIAGLIGDATDRPDLKDWLGLTTQQKDEKEAWKTAHPDDPLSQLPKPKARAKAKPTPTAATSMPLAEVTEKSRLLRPKPPPLKLNPPVPPTYTPHEITTGQIMIGCISAGIALMLVVSYFVQSRSATLPAVGNAGPFLAQPCPAGEVPADMLVPPPLAHGEIIDDTEETSVRPPLAHGEIIDDTE